MSAPPSSPTSWAPPRQSGSAGRSPRWPASPSSSSSSLETIELGHGPLETVLDRDEHGVRDPRLNPMVAGGPPALADAHPAKGKVELVVDDQGAFQRHPVLYPQGFARRPRKIHHRLRLCEHQLAGPPAGAGGAR